MELKSTSFAGLEHAAGVLAFVRSGWVGPSNGAVNNVGQNGYGRSRTAVSATNARYLNFNPTGVNPSNNNNRFDGLPLR